MNPQNTLILSNLSFDGLSPFMQEFKAVNRLIDAAYDQAAAANGFVCNGCEQSCCETLFYHHTVIEYGLLREGLMKLADARRQKIVHLAVEACRRAQAAEEQKKPYRIMCPLNADGRCRLYDFRPMICRMHGIAHELTRPDGVRLLGDGCRLFQESYSTANPVRLDRTPFYRKTADLEKRVRSTFGIQIKIKMTIAQMILAATHDDQANTSCALWT